MRRPVLALGLLLAMACPAQQPDIRLQVLSLYKIRQAEVHPLSGARLHWCAACPATPWTEALHVSALRSLLRNDESGKSAEGLWLDGGVRVEFDGGPPRTLRTPLEIHAKAGELVFITRLPVEEYTAAVVQGETSGDMPPEALRAMAVAARTYTTHFRERHKTEHFDFCDSTHCQFVNAGVSPAVEAAVEQTRGELLWERGKTVAAYYHQDCGGKTEAAANAWPVATHTADNGQSDPYCVRLSKPWRSEVSRRDLAAALQSSGLRVPSRWEQIRVLRRTSSGRAETLLLADAGGANGVELSASSLRFAVGRAMGWAVIKSNLYEVVASGDHFVFTGRGTGHGVGLCQLGAAEMAREGKSYREILAFYYPRAVIGVAASGIVWKKSASSRLDVFSVDDESVSILQSAMRALAWAEAQTHMQPAERPAVYVYPSVEMFRNATGEPGWVAASTRDNNIRMQPAKVLGSRVEGTLRHELIHLLLESHTAPGTPLLFREGMAMLLSGDAPHGPQTLSAQRMESILRERGDAKQMQAAYASSLATVARLEQRYGRSSLLSWLRDGVPSGVIEIRTQDASHHR
jgi:stage II sporulation protein D